MGGIWAGPQSWENFSYSTKNLIFYFIQRNSQILKHYTARVKNEYLGAGYAQFQTTEKNVFVFDLYPLEKNMKLC